MVSAQVVVTRRSGQRAIRDHMNRLRGRMFTLVEAVGWPEGQQESIKSLVRHVSYDCQVELEAAVGALEREIVDLREQLSVATTRED